MARAPAKARAKAQTAASSGTIAAATLVAAANLAIEGKHFDAGAPIEGVSDEQLSLAVSARRVVTRATFEGKDDPEPEEDPSTDAPDEA